MELKRFRIFSFGFGRIIFQKLALFIGTITTITLGCFPGGYSMEYISQGIPKKHRTLIQLDFLVNEKVKSE